MGRVQGDVNPIPVRQALLSDRHLGVAGACRMGAADLFEQPVAERHDLRLFDDRLRRHEVPGALVHQLEVERRHQAPRRHFGLHELPQANPHARATDRRLQDARNRVELRAAMLDELGQAVAPGAHCRRADGPRRLAHRPRTRDPGEPDAGLLPAYSPELNAIERVGLDLRERFFSHRLWPSYEDILDACCAAWYALLAEPGRIRSLCALDWAAPVSP
jgi:hypothetical protein